MLSLSLSTCISLLFLHDPSYYSNSLLLSRRFCKGVLQEGLQHCLESSCSGSAPASSIRFLHPGSDPKMTKIISVYCCGSMMFNDVQCVCVRFLRQEQSKFFALCMKQQKHTLNSDIIASTSTAHLCCCCCPVCSDKPRRK